MPINNRIQIHLIHKHPHPSSIHIPHHTSETNTKQSWADTQNKKDWYNIDEHLTKQIIKHPSHHQKSLSNLKLDTHTPSSLNQQNTFKKQWLPHPQHTWSILKTNLKKTSEPRQKYFSYCIPIHIKTSTKTDQYRPDADTHFPLTHAARKSQIHDPDPGPKQSKKN